MARGKLFLIMGPSGVGKDTMINILKERHPEFHYMRSITTREPRPGEDLSRYDFVSKEAFEEMIAEDAFLEWANPYGLAYYGTLKAPILYEVEKGLVVYKTMELNGYRMAKKTEVATDIYSVFLLPPSMEVLRSRIEHRGGLQEEEIQKRLQRAQEELKEGEQCDAQIVSEEGKIEEVYQVLEKLMREHMND